MLTLAGWAGRVVAAFTNIKSMPTPIFHYCQKCVAPNPLGQDFCVRCGTRLMIVVEPSAARFELSEQAISTDEHLLERISILESRVSRLTERLERTLETFS